MAYEDDYGVCVTGVFGGGGGGGSDGAAYRGGDVEL